MLQVDGVAVCFSLFYIRFWRAVTRVAGEITDEEKEDLENETS
jgi:hypothetical protein